MKYDDKIGLFKSNNHVVDLGWILPLGRLKFNTENKEIKYSPDNKKWFKSQLKTSNQVDFKGQTARFIQSETEFEVEVFVGEGYIASYDEEWTKLFSKNMFWTGGDGFYTFNLKNGVERNDLSEDEVKTLCVFGDTLTCTFSPDNRRLDPLLMPNSSVAIIDGKSPKAENTQFIINKDRKGHLISFMEPTVELGYKGTLAAHLTREGHDSDQTPWLTTYYPDQVEVLFDFNRTYHLKQMEIYNYYLESDVDYGYENRGLKYVEVFYGNDMNHLLFLGKYELDKASRELKGKNYKTIPFEGLDARYVKIRSSNVPGVGNFGGVNGIEPLFGLSKVRFQTTEGQYLIDVIADASSELFKDTKRSWYWLQDGVYINNKLYFFPMIVVQDLNQPEGFQFAIEGISLLTVPVENEMPQFDQMIQKDTNLFQKIDGRDWYWGAGFYSNTEAAGAPDPDGYIYIYGYTFQFAEIEYGRKMRVARVKPEHIDNFNEWRFFNGKEWTSNMLEAASILDHVSCELSVSYDHGKYVAAFTYDVQSPYVSYAIGDTLTGPFTEPRIAYCAPEKGDKLYHYNAKAHPHISNQDSLLVSYNVNTASMEENMSNGKVYAPRFVRLNYVKREE